MDEDDDVSTCLRQRLLPRKIPIADAVRTFGSHAHVCHDDIVIRISGTHLGEETIRFDQGRVPGVVSVASWYG